MPVVQQGSINTTALIVPDLYVQIVPPSVTVASCPALATGGVLTTPQVSVSHAQAVIPPVMS